MSGVKSALSTVGLLIILMSLVGCDQPITHPVALPETTTPIETPTRPSPEATTATPVPPWQEDLTLLQEALLTSRSRTASESRAIEAAIDALAVKFETSDKQAVMLAMARLVAQYGEAEVLAELGLHRAFAQSYPVKLGIYDGEFYVTDAVPSYRSLVGMQLIRIERTPDAAVVRALEELVPQSDPDLARAHIAELATRPAVLASLGIVPSDSDTTWVLLGPGGVRRRVSMGGVPVSSLTWSEMADDPPGQITMLPEAENYAFWADMAHNCIVFRYAYAEELIGLPFEAFLQDMFVTSDELVPLDLVIDLRGNPGGRVAQIETLLGYLGPRVEASWIRHVHVMVDAETRGAALDGAVRLKEAVSARVSADAATRLALWRHHATYVTLPYTGLSLGVQPSTPQPYSSLIDTVIYPDPRRDGREGDHDALLQALLAGLSGWGSEPSSARESPRDLTAQIPSPPRPTRAELWRHDLDAVVALMRDLAEEHGGRFEVVEAPAYQTMVQTLSAKIPNLEDHKVVVGLMQLLAQAQDAHTTIPVKEWATFSSLQYPIRVQWFADALYITEVQPGFEALLGSEIVTINAVSPQEILDALALWVSHETRPGLVVASEPLLVNPFVLQALGTASTLTEVTLELRSLAGTEGVHVLPALAEEAPIPTAVDITTWHTVLAPSSTALWQRQPDTTFYWSTLLDDGRVLYFQWNACKEQADVPYAPFLEAMFEAADQAGAQRIVVDLRRNEGGFSQYLAPFLVRLRQRPHLLEPGHLNVLVGRRTFSTAAYLAGVLQVQYGGRLIGEPMGQAPPFYASIEAFVLPNAQLVVHYPTQLWSVSPEEDVRLTITTPVALTFNDYLIGRDPVLQAALSSP